MPKKDNNDIINNILNELDQKKKDDTEKKPEEPRKTAVSEKPVSYTTSAVQRPVQRPVSQPENSSPYVGRYGKYEKAPEQPSTEPTEEKSTETKAEPVVRNVSEKKSNPEIRKSPERAKSENSRNAPVDSPAPPKKKKKKKKKQRNRLPGVLILTTFIFAVSICLSLVIIAYGKDILGIGKSDTTHLIVIPENATTEEISLLLEENDIIKSPECFQLFSRLSNSDSEYIAGEHFVRPNMAYETIIQELTSEDNEKHESVEVTFPEGITLYDAAVLLEDNGVCSADDFIFYFNSGGLGFDFEDKLTASSNLKFYRMEGYLFPDTYYFSTDMDAERVCQKIYLNFDTKMTEERYERMDQLGLTLDQLITFASIVQREAATTESMTIVASVFWNRLNHPDEFPLLQSDPTKNYAEQVIKPHMEVYDQAMIDAYDTYVGTGLPPGAICNPGLEAIDAVLEAFESDYYYFVANIYTGQTYPAATLEEHEANVAMVEEQIANSEGLED